MGQITIFERDDCKYCVRVTETLERLASQVLKELNGKGNITFRKIKATGSDAALCVRLTSSFTVPHVFFQREYIGNCDVTCELANQENCNNIIIEKLKILALLENPSPPFPPAGNTEIFKLTEHLAISAQPSREQIKMLKSIGFQSLINLTTSDELSYDKDEASLCSSSYYSIPLHLSSSDGAVLQKELVQILQTIESAAKPILLHCDTGKRAVFVGLCTVLLAQRSEEVRDKKKIDFTEEDFEKLIEWGVGLEYDLKPITKLLR